MDEDEDTSLLRDRIAGTPIELRRPQADPQTRSRGIGVGVLLGALLWTVVLAVAVEGWRWLARH